MTKNYPVTTKTVIKYGVELPWERKETYGSELLYPSHSPRAGEPMYPERKPTGTVIESGVVFVDAEVLEELLEVDNSLGMGGAYLCGYHEGMALEKAGLALRETRGGYFTREAERKKLNKVLSEIYSAMKAGS